MFLDQLKPGQAVQVTYVGCQEALRSRLADFGMVPGTCVCCRYTSPGRDVMALELRGTVLAVRSSDLGLISGRTV